MCIIGLRFPYQCRCNGRACPSGGNSVMLSFAGTIKSRAEPSRAEPSRAEPSRAEPSRAEPSRAEPQLWPDGCARPAGRRPSCTEPSERPGRGGAGDRHCRGFDPSPASGVAPGRAPCVPARLTAVALRDAPRLWRWCRPAPSPFPSPRERARGAGQRASPSPSCPSEPPAAARRPRGRRLLCLAALLVACAAVLGAAAPAQADILVANIKKATANNWVIDAAGLAQAFTAPAGYHVRTIYVKLSNISANHAPTVTLRAANSANEPGETLETLTGPATVSSGEQAFHVPAGGVVLQPGTYFVHLTYAGARSTAPSVAATSSDAYVGQAGWSIANSLLRAPIKLMGVGAGRRISPNRRRRGRRHCPPAHRRRDHLVPGIRGHVHSRRNDKGEPDLQRERRRDRHTPGIDRDGLGERRPARREVCLRERYECSGFQLCGDRQAMSIRMASASTPTRWHRTADPLPGFKAAARSRVHPRNGLRRWAGQGRAATARIR